MVRGGKDDTTGARMSNETTPHGRETEGVRAGRLYLWTTLRWKLAFLALATAGFAGWMTAASGEWRLALLIGAPLLAMTGLVGLLGRKVLVRRS